MNVPIKKYVMDETLSWEERYKQLEAHREKEIKWLINQTTKLKKHIQELKHAVNNPPPPCPEGGYCDKNGKDGSCAICGWQAHEAWDFAITGPYG